MYIGVDIGGTKCAVIRGTADGQVAEKRKFPTADVQSTLAAILDAAQELAAGQDIRAAGVSCGGPLDEERGLILSPPNLPGWDEIPICDLLTERLGVPCGLRNDANACALAEWMCGAGQGSRNMIFLTFGTGFGAGLILDGKLYAGANGQAGEIGHVRMAPDGPVGYGKAGSMEGFCSGGGLAQLGAKLAREYAARGETPSFWHGEDTPLTAADIAVAAEAGDACAREVYRQSGEKLGEGLAILADLFNPDRVVIGSIYQRSTDLLEPAMREAFRREALPLTYEICKVVPAALGDRVGDVAALAVAAETEERRKNK